LLSVVFDKTYPQFIEVFFTFFIGFISVYLVFAYFKKRSIYLYKDHISFRFGFLLKSIEVRNDAILSWAEVAKSNKRGEWKELTIFTATKKYRFQSNHYNGYELLKDNITKEKPRNLDFEENWKTPLNRNISLLLIVLGLIFLFFSAKSLLNSNKLVDKNQLVETNLIVKSGLKIIRYKNSESIHLRFTDNPEFEFTIDPSIFNDGAKKFISDINRRDTLTISISKEDFEKKISKTKPLTFEDKSFGYYTIYLYSISHKDKSYLSLDEYEKHQQSIGQSSFWVCFILGFLLFSTGFYTRIQNS
jgi:hypothetical protein